MTPWQLIKSDLYRYAGKYSLSIFLRNLILNSSFSYMFWFRLLKSKSVVIRGFASVMHRILSVRYQIQIPREVEIGAGLYIGHGTGLIVNSSAIIGSNCNLSPFTVIGSNFGKAAIIGNNVYIGPHVCLVENVNIGNGAIIGAGTIVLKDVPERSVMVGNPGRIVSLNHKHDFIRNPYSKQV
jgi:serine O-acetyltransferase